MTVGEARQQIVLLAKRGEYKLRMTEALDELHRQILIEDAEFKAEAAYDYLVEVLSVAAAGGRLGDIEATAAEVVRRLAHDD